MDSTIDITRFNPKEINNRRLKKGPPTCVFIGKRGTGKSTLAIDILYHCRKIPLGIVMSATEEGNEFYQKYVPDSLVYGDYDATTIENVIATQKKKIKSKNGKDNDIFILLDDCMYDKGIMTKDKSIRGIFMNGRHWKIMFILTMQYCMDLPPALRGNIDYVFVLRENIIQTQKKLYDKFFGIFPTFKEFQQVMNKCTEGHDCLVLDNTSLSNKIEDCVFWYRAKPNRKFHIGSKELWKYHREHYCTDHYLREKKKKKKEDTTVKKRGVRTRDR